MWKSLISIYTKTSNTMGTTNEDRCDKVKSQIAEETIWTKTRVPNQNTYWLTDDTENH